MTNAQYMGIMGLLLYNFLASADHPLFLAAGAAGWAIMLMLGMDWNQGNHE